MPVAGQNTDRYATEHILEFQLLHIFLESLNECQYLRDYWSPGATDWVTINGIRKTPVQHVALQFPGHDNAYNREFVLLDSSINTAKTGVSSSRRHSHHTLVLVADIDSQMWREASINSPETMTNYEQQMPDKAIKNMKDVLGALKYHQIPDVRTILLDQASRVGAMLDKMDNELVNRQGYRKMQLQSKWKLWIKGRADEARSKAETYLEAHLKHLLDVYGSEYARQEKFADTVLLRKIDSLDAAIKGRTPWVNPFP